jgi:hypothetical protein
MLLVISTIYGFMSMATEMGLAILAGALGLAFSNLDKISKFKGAGFEAEMNMVHTMLENQTEPTPEQKEESKAKDDLTSEENRILITLQKPGYTWRYANTVASETNIGKDIINYNLHALMQRGFCKNDSGSKGEIWSITALGKNVQEQHQIKNA